VVDIVEAVKRLLSAYPDSERIYIAYSGGLDSQVLLHCCASQVAFRNKITAIHVHHGLQPEAERWVKHCAGQSRQLDIAFQCLRVDAKAVNGQSPEEAARDARYRALRSLIRAGDVLLTAQHREDQLETVLLQLFRGAGLAGLAGIPKQMRFGKGYLLRPLLPVAKWQIQEYARQHRLQWIEDPSNQEDDFDRNYLRNRVIPLLKQRWPALDKTVTRSGKHCAEAHHYLAQVGDNLLRSVYDPEQGTLYIKRLQEKSRFEQRQIIRAWFLELGLRMPSSQKVEQIRIGVVLARQDSCPQLQGKGFIIRRYRDRLYCLLNEMAIDRDYRMNWTRWQHELALPGNGCLLALPTRQAGLSKACWESSRASVGYRQGGESIRLPGRSGRHGLKKLFQEKAIPPWIRNRIPLLYFDEQLVAVGDLWISAEFFRPEGSDNLRLQWLQNDFSFEKS